MAIFIFFSINLSIFQQFFLEVTKQQPIHVNLSVCLTTNSPKHVVKLKKMASYHLMKCSSSYLVQIFEQKDVFAGFLQSLSLLICFGVSDLKCTAKHCGILGSRCHRNAQKRKSLISIACSERPLTLGSLSSSSSSGLYASAQTVQRGINAGLKRLVQTTHYCAITILCFDQPVKIETTNFMKKLILMSAFIGLLDCLHG